MSRVALLLLATSLLALAGAGAAENVCFGVEGEIDLVAIAGTTPDPTDPDASAIPIVVVDQSECSG